MPRPPRCPADRPAVRSRDPPAASARVRGPPQSSRRSPRTPVGRTVTAHPATACRRHLADDCSDALTILLSAEAFGRSRRSSRSATSSRGTTAASKRPAATSIHATPQRTSSTALAVSSPAAARASASAWRPPGARSPRASCVSSGRATIHPTRCRRDDPRHLAAENALRRLSIRRSRPVDLFADGDPPADGHELHQLHVELMVWKAGHRQGVWPLVAAGEREVEEIGGLAGIVAEEFVEIPHTKTAPAPPGTGLLPPRIAASSVTPWRENVAAFDACATRRTKQVVRTPMRGPCDGGL